MPDMNGLTATRMLEGAAPGEPRRGADPLHDDAYVQELLRAGVAGYVLKQSASSELLQAIRAAAGGGHTSIPRGRPGNRRFLSRDGTKTRQARPAVTEREGEVLRLMALGHSNKDIAADLDISVKTVEVHKANAMRKLGLRGRIDIVRYAMLHGWLQDG